jgi:hypothetical protein
MKVLLQKFVNGEWLDGEWFDVGANAKSAAR